MKTLNEKIVEVLKKHPEGEDFFDALDFMVRSDMNILNQFMHFVEDHFKSYYGYTHTLVADDNSTKDVIGIILTGEFGRILANKFFLGRMKYNSRVILVNGGIRKGAPVDITTDTYSHNYIMLDVSFYSGTTRDAIMAELKNYDSSARLLCTYVVYDGSKEKDFNVKSLFRYHN